MTPTEDALVAARFDELARRIAAAEFRDRELDRALLEELHGALFDGVLATAGRCRGPDVGSDRVAFGPYLSYRRADVEGGLRHVFASVPRFAAGVARYVSDDEARRRHELAVAVWVGSELGRVHPFEDGNGRVARLCVAHVLVRFGQPAIAIATMSPVHVAALERYYDERDANPLIDVFAAARS